MIDIRRVFTQVEHIHHEFGPRAATPLVRGALAAVLTNPFAGRYEPDILPMMKLLDPVGVDMARRLRAAMDVPVERIATYGKGAIVGAAGELEHGALWHVPGGYAMRELLGWKGDRDAYRQGKAEEKTGQPGNALSIVPSTKKVGPPGATLRCAAHQHQRELCARPVRRDRGPCARCSCGGRDRLHPCDDDGLPHP